MDKMRDTYSEPVEIPEPEEMEIEGEKIGKIKDLEELEGRILYDSGSETFLYINNYDDLLDYDYEDIYNLGETINLMGMNRNGISILNQVGRSRRGFYDIGGPLWADVEETYKDIPDGLHQYVGHSQLKDFYKHSKGNSSITYCDVLGTIDKAMIINI